MEVRCRFLFLCSSLQYLVWSLICKKYMLEYILSRKDGFTFFSTNSLASDADSEYARAFYTDVASIATNAMMDKKAYPQDI